MIKVESLSKTYGERLAVDNISFYIKKGEIVGFLGPQRSRKIAIMRAMTGFLIPTEGEVCVSECNMRNDPFQAWQQISYLPETIPI